MKDIAKTILIKLFGIIIYIISFIALLRYYYWLIRKTIKLSSQGELTYLKLFSVGLSLSALHILPTTLITVAIVYATWNKEAGETGVFVLIVGLICIWGTLIYKKFLSEVVNEKITIYYKNKIDNDDDYN